MLSRREIRRMMKRHVNRWYGENGKERSAWVLERRASRWSWVCFGYIGTVYGYDRAWRLAKRLANADGVPWRIRTAGDQGGRIKVALPVEGVE